jgi:hypothetical protein
VFPHGRLNVEVFLLPRFVPLRWVQVEIKLRLTGSVLMDRLQRLIFSYYREEPALQQLLHPLHSCRMRRSWGSVRIECLDDGHLEEVSALLGYLREPLAALDLGRQIVLRGSGSRQRSYPMHVPFHSDQLA